MTNEASKTTSTEIVIEAEHDGEAGQVFMVTCPQCKDTVAVASSAWWDQRCSCGYRWTVELVARGEK